MARGVYDVDFGILIVDGGILGQNGDAALTLQVVGVHDTLHRGLILPVDAALLEHLVHQGGLAVVNVGNDGYVSQFLVSHLSFSLLSGCFAQPINYHGNVDTIPTSDQNTVTYYIPKCVGLQRQKGRKTRPIPEKFLCRIDSIGGIG